MFMNKDDSKALNSIQKILLHNLQKKHYLREKNILLLNRISNIKEYIHNVYIDVDMDVDMDVDIDYNTQSDTQDNTQSDTQSDTQGDTQSDTQSDTQGDKDNLYNIKKSVEFSKSPIVKESSASQVLNTITDFIFN